MKINYQIKKDEEIIYFGSIDIDIHDATEEYKIEEDPDNILFQYIEETLDDILFQYIIKHNINLDETELYIERI